MVRVDAMPAEQRAQLLRISNADETQGAPLSQRIFIDLQLF
jgi:hypothetical protein